MGVRGYTSCQQCSHLWLLRENQPLLLLLEFKSSFFSPRDNQSPFPEGPSACRAVPSSPHPSRGTIGELSVLLCDLQLLGFGAPSRWCLPLPSGRLSYLPGVEFLGPAYLGLNGSRQTALQNTYSNFLFSWHCPGFLVLCFLAETQCYQA